MLETLGIHNWKSFQVLAACCLLFLLAFCNCWGTCSPSKLLWSHGCENFNGGQLLIWQTYESMENEWNWVQHTSARLYPLPFVETSCLYSCRCCVSCTFAPLQSTFVSCKTTAHGFALNYIIYCRLLLLLTNTWKYVGCMLKQSNSWGEHSEEVEWLFGEEAWRPYVPSWIFLLFVQCCSSSNAIPAWIWHEWLWS